MDVSLVIVNSRLYAISLSAPPLALFALHALIAPAVYTLQRQAMARKEIEKPEPNFYLQEVLAQAQEVAKTDDPTSTQVFVTRETTVHVDLLRSDELGGFKPRPRSSYDSQSLPRPSFWTALTPPLSSGRPVPRGFAGPPGLENILGLDVPAEPRHPSRPVVSVLNSGIESRNDSRPVSRTITDDGVQEEEVC